MVLVSTRGYILDIWAGYGGSGKCNDANLWRHILKTDPTFVHFCKENGICVVGDRGFKDKHGDAEDDEIFFVAPKRRGKNGKGKKSNVSAKDSNWSRFVTKIRHIVERINKVAIKKWLLLGGKVLHYEFIDDIEDLVSIACALWNRYTGCLDEERYDGDEEDFHYMIKVSKVRTFSFAEKILLRFCEYLF